MSARQAEVLEPTAPAGADLRGLGAFPAPQVNLLPPDVTSRRKLGRTKVRLGAALVAVLLLVVAGYGYGVVMRSQASDRLALQQAEVARILEEQAKYAEVPQVKNEIGQLESAQTLGMSTEILWKDYVQAIQAVSPADFRLKSLTTNAPTPNNAVVGSDNPLIANGIGAITFSGEATNLPDISAWIVALDSIPGFSGAFFSTAVYADDNGTSFYAVSSTVQIDESAFALRFASKDGQ